MYTNTYARWLGASLAALVLPLQAQQRHADDARADVPATRYQAAYDYQAPQAGSTSPERNWQALNRIVAGADQPPHQQHDQHQQHQQQTQTQHQHQHQHQRNAEHPPAPPEKPAPQAAPAHRHHEEHQP